MLEDVVFISMEGKKDFYINDFLVRDDVMLPVFVENKDSFSYDKLTPENIITGMIKVIMSETENEHLDYYRDFIFSVNPNIEASLSSVAYEAEKNEHFEDAIEMFKVLIALKPESIDNNLNLAVCYDEYSQYLQNKGEEKEQSKYEEYAFNFYKIVDSYEFKTEPALFYLGRFYLLRENYEKSVEYFREFAKISGDKEKIEEVKKLLNDIENLGITDTDYNTAIELIHCDKDTESLGYIDRYIDKFPQSWNGYYIKSLALKKTGDFNGAIECLKKSLELNSNSSDIYNELGLNYMNLSMFRESELNFYKALKFRPEDSVIIGNLALLNYKKGNFSEAKKYCQVILEFNDKDLFAKDILSLIEDELK